jgi:anthranilate synthase component 1
MPNLNREEFAAYVRACRGECGTNVTLAIPLALRVLSDQLTPVLAYRRLVAPDQRNSPSFLLESVEGGERQGRYSILGSHPVEEIVCKGSATGRGSISIRMQRDDAPTMIATPLPSDDPFAQLRHRTAHIKLCRPPARGSKDELPACVLGGWFGYAAYDSVRYGEPGKLPFANAPRDDRNLADLHFGFYDGVIAFDHVDKVLFIVQLAFVGADDDADFMYDAVVSELKAKLAQIERHSKPLASGLMERELGMPAALPSNITREEHAAMLGKAREYIKAGDIFQVVLGQRFERRSKADPFDVYRALRAVNPSPYMVYMQCEGCILVASSPEILCRVKRGPGGERTVTNRPLAGTRRRGRTVEEDAALAKELLADQKECAEHIMLVDLGRNDVGVVAQAGSVALPAIMEIERYSHVMHISSTVTGALREGLDCWDALRAALPVGTISGAPKIRAMQIIDELEPVRRGPYGGGMGYVGLDGDMDIALALRTMVVPTGLKNGEEWVYHLQAAGGIVADSNVDDEYQETVNKAAALARAIVVAEGAFGG